MVTLTSVSNRSYSGKTVGEWNGLSTDAKPTENVGNGSCFIEMDTGTVYFFDEAGQAWREFA